MSRKNSRPRTSVRPSTAKAPALGRLEVHRLEARQILGDIAERTFAGLVSDGTIPTVSRGRGGRLSVYDVTTMVPAYLKHVTKDRPRGERDARARKDVSQAELNELRLARERAELLPRELVITEGQQYTKAWTAKLRALPRRLVQSGLVSREREGDVDALVREILVEISSWKTIADVDQLPAAGAAPPS